MFVDECVVWNEYALCVCVCVCVCVLMFVVYQHTIIKVCWCVFDYDESVWGCMCMRMCVDKCWCVMYGFNKHDTHQLNEYVSIDECVYEWIFVLMKVSKHQHHTTHLNIWNIMEIKLSIESDVFESDCVMTVCWKCVFLMSVFVYVCVYESVNTHYMSV